MSGLGCSVDVPSPLRAFNTARGRGPQAVGPRWRNHFILIDSSALEDTSMFRIASIRFHLRSPVQNSFMSCLANLLLDGCIVQRV
jgi:hypothetical protein